jgi:hypothetical protein
VSDRRIKEQKAIFRAAINEGMPSHSLQTHTVTMEEGQHSCKSLGEVENSTQLKRSRESHHQGLSPILNHTAQLARGFKDNVRPEESRMLQTPLVEGDVAVKVGLVPTNGHHVLALGGNRLAT